MMGDLQWYLNVLSWHGFLNDRNAFRQGYPFIKLIPQSGTLPLHPIERLKFSQDARYARLKQSYLYCRFRAVDATTLDAKPTKQLNW